MGDEGDRLYTLAAPAKRCHAKSDVRDYILTYGGWPEKVDTKMCPKHFAQLSRSKLVGIEAIEGCAERVALKEAGAQAEGQRCGSSSRASPKGSARSTANSSSASYASATAENTVEKWHSRGCPRNSVDDYCRVANLPLINNNEYLWSVVSRMIVFVVALVSNQWEIRICKGRFPTECLRVEIFPTFLTGNLECF